MQKVTITRVYRGAIDIAGKSTKKITIKTNVHGEAWLGCLPGMDKRYDDLKEGDMLDIIVIQSGNYVNFKLPSKTDLLEVRVEKIEQHLFGGRPITTAETTSNGEPYPPADDVPPGF